MIIAQNYQGLCRVKEILKNPKRFRAGKYFIYEVVFCQESFF